MTRVVVDDDEYVRHKSDLSGKLACSIPGREEVGSLLF